MMIESEFIPIDELMGMIPDYVEKVYGIPKNEAIRQLTPIKSCLRRELTCFIEYPYVDKFYRDSYYHFFSTKHKQYNRDSIRISFFDSSLCEDEFFEKYTNEDLNNLFFGFITLRPTTYRIIGHSFLSPIALINNDFVCALTSKSVLIKGRKLNVNGFPYIGQDNEAISCSEAVILNLYDYFGNKYAEYSTLLPSQVHRILSKYSWERQLPTKGITTQNISYVLKKLGFGTIVYSRGMGRSNNLLYDSQDFRDLFYIYIESGIPVIATLTSGISHHAVVAIGRPQVENDKDLMSGITLSSLFGRPNELLFSNAFEKVLIMNDNHPPYELVDFDTPLNDSESNDDFEFTSFIVPLHSKVHLDASQFKKFFIDLLSEMSSAEKTKHIDFLPKGNYITRFYLASSRSYKDYIACSDTLSSDFKDVAINISMPKLVWVGEVISGSKLESNQKVKSVIIVDATESGVTANLIWATNSRYLILKNTGFEPFEVNNGYTVWDFNSEEFYTFANNLKGNHTEWRS